MKAINFTIDGHLPSRANARGHHMKLARIWKAQRTSAWAVTLDKLGLLVPVFPITVTLTRVSPKQLDGHDNLKSAFKSTVDGIADALGMDDRDPRIDWRYDQRKGKPPRAEIQIQEARGG